MMKNKHILGMVLAIVAGLVIFFATPPNGLNTDSMKALGVVCFTIICFSFKLLPQFAIVVLMSAMLVVFDVLPFQTVFGAFSDTTFWLIIAALGIGATISKCGLLKRISLYIMKLFPPTFKGMIFALLGVGTICAPLIPSTAAKLSMISPITRDIGNILGYDKYSKRMAGLFNAMFVGWCINGTLFISASFLGYMVIGLLPTNIQIQFDWTTWFLGMIPYGIFLIIASYLVINWMYNEEDDKKTPKKLIKKQIYEIGPMTKNEKIAMAILTITIIFWITERLHGISSSIVGIFSFVVMVFLKLFTTEDFQTRIPWGLVFFIGGVTNISVVFSHQELGIGKWLGGTLSPILQPLMDNPYLFVIVFTFIIYAIRLIMPSYSSLMIILIVVVSPVATSAGINPWVVAIVTYCSVLTWNNTYQNVSMLIGWAAFGGDEYLDFNLVRKGSYAYMFINLAGLLISIPYWQMLGYII